MTQCSKTHDPGRFASQREQARRQLVAVSRFPAETAEIEIGFRLLLHQGKDPVPPGFRVRAIVKKILLLNCSAACSRRSSSS
jgi:hypothetical protein